MSINDLVLVSWVKDMEKPYLLSPYFIICHLSLLAWSFQKIIFFYSFWLLYVRCPALWSFTLLFSEPCLILQYPFWDWVIRSTYSIPGETPPLIYIMAVQYLLHYSPSYVLSFKTSCLLFLPQLSTQLRSLMSFLQWYQTIFKSSYS